MSANEPLAGAPDGAAPRPRYDRGYAEPGLLRTAWSSLRREGPGYVAAATALWLLLPLQRVWFRKARRTFTLRGRRYEYFLHRYNLTSRNERAVEVPIVLEEIRAAAGRSVLEVGNVLSHYVAIAHPVVDRYERAPGVRNEDLLDLARGERYDLIVSISTLEHVGWDEEPRDPAKLGRALAGLAERLSAPGGRLLATFPVGYNPWLDALLAEPRGPFSRVDYLCRVGRTAWVEAEAATALRCRFHSPWPFANAVAIAVIER